MGKLNVVGRKLPGRYANHWFRPWRGHIKATERRVYGRIIRRRDRRMTSNWRDEYEDDVFDGCPIIGRECPPECGVGGGQYC